MLKLFVRLKPFAPYILVLWIIIIAVVSSLPALPVLKIHTSKKDIRLDYLIHFLEYGSLAFLAFLSSADKNFRMKSTTWLIVLLCLTVFALADEYHQVFIPGRAFNTRDIISNISGIAGGSLFSYFLLRIIYLKMSITTDI